ncbi:hypothetical protein GXW71_31660 [Roseomonas hellenica]|uniref:FAD-dependent urate hydroxylase HpyO/Asp monooxygenase CreE-like FAD/NAD(P)-binding domain-containing protein n=1 Tax=Plastoroseomonas hellenica TaxID=2687306 RepID=A0ABS5F8R2_9PROT|nr:FAD/NAD(P)-binding protein [Plastoroseomonas hellenica]MBR0668949.1 hypothetical protein [Plastoroseomonas hellenica]
MPSIPEHDIAILGAGFSGSLLAIHLTQRRGGADGLLLVERAAIAGPGTAYGTRDPIHLLNVPARGMSAFPDAPAHFLDWAREQPPSALGPLSDGVAPDAFLPRALYGAYLRTTLAEAGITHRRAEVSGVTRDGDAWVIATEAGPIARARTVVLATGNPPPARGGDAHLRGDPWAPGALDGIPPDAPVLLVGTGLTMVDTLLSLRLTLGHRGPIHAISRHGWLPLAHLPQPRPWPHAFTLPEPGASPRAVLRLLRAEAARAAAEGVPWQPVIDALRPATRRCGAPGRRPSGRASCAISARSGTCIGTAWRRPPRRCCGKRWPMASCASAPRGCSAMIRRRRGRSPASGCAAARRQRCRSRASCSAPGPAAAPPPARNGWKRRRSVSCAPTA